MHAPTKLSSRELFNRRLAFYAVSLPAILLLSFFASQTYADASLLNGHDPIESSPAELGLPAQWFDAHNLSNIPPYPGYRARR